MSGTKSSGPLRAVRPPTAVGYNGVGQPTSMTVGGVSYTMTYNAQGRLATIVGGGLTQTVSYDGNGRVSGVA